MFNSDRTRIIRLHIGSETIFYIQEDFASKYSTSIDEYITKKHPSDQESANLVPVYLQCSPQLENFEESMFLFIDFIYYTELKREEDEFWEPYSLMQDSSLLIHAWILGSVLKAEWFQDCIFRALVGIEFDLSPRQLSEVWSAAPDDDKAGLPDLLMHKFMIDLEEMSHDGLMNLMSCYGKEPFMAKVFISLVDKLKVAKIWIDEDEVNEMINNSSSARDDALLTDLKLAGIVEPSSDEDDHIL